jgi:ParB-like chromosome segregation protein Spo0J
MTEKIARSIRPVNTSECIPMPELNRKYYDQSNFFYLKNVIQHDGFDKSYPIRAIYNKKKKKYEVFDGIHRLRVAEALEIKKIHLLDESSFLTRAMAIAKGIKANKSHASYNPIDIAHNLKALSERLKSGLIEIENTRKGVIRRAPKNPLGGRPLQYDLSELANQTSMTVDKVSEYLRLLKLPEEVQDLVGQGKLWLTSALILLKLDNTQYESRISGLAKDSISGGWSSRKLESIVKSIISKGSYQEDAKLCGFCKKPFPMEQRSPYICPDCFNKFKIIKENEKTIAMRKYLKFNNHAEELKKQGKIITPKLQDYLDELHRGWLGKNIDQPSYIR